MAYRSSSNKGEEVYYLVLFALAAIFLIIGFIINLMQSLFYFFFPTTFLVLALCLLSLLASIKFDGYPNEITKILLVIFIACAIIVFVSYQIGFGIGGTDFGSAAKESFDITMKVFFKHDLNAIAGNA